MRVLGILWVIYGHVYIFGMQMVGFSNPREGLAYDGKGFGAGIGERSGGGGGGGC